MKALANESMLIGNTLGEPRCLFRTTVNIYDEELCSNSLHQKAVDYCYKALHLRYLRESRIRHWNLKTN